MTSSSEDTKRLEAQLSVIARLAFEQLKQLDPSLDPDVLGVEKGLRDAGFSYREISRMTGTSLGALSKRLGS